MALIRVAARNAAQLDAPRRRLTPLREPYQRARSALVRNTPRRSRRDIAAHYDLGNEFFALMLDPTMMYSSARFVRPGMSLDEASVAKLELVCDKLELGPRDHVLEIGTGWGGFAVHAARTRGCRVTSTTLSREQRGSALARARAAGVEHRVTVLGADYRELRGRFDKLVSIEMIEAVGWKDFGTFFERCARLLEPNGAMLLQAITIDDRAYDVERASKSFIRTHIFPNGCLPSIEVIARCLARRTDLRMMHMEDFGTRLRGDAATLEGEHRASRRAPGRARLRRALPAAVADVSLLLRGRLRGAPHRRRPDGARQASLGGPSAAAGATGRGGRRLTVASSPTICMSFPTQHAEPGGRRRACGGGRSGREAGYQESR